MTEPIRPIGSDSHRVEPVVVLRRLTAIEREQQREARKRRRRTAPQPPPDEPGHVDIRG